MRFLHMCVCTSLFGNRQAEVNGKPLKEESKVRKAVIALAEAREQEAAAVEEETQLLSDDGVVDPETYQSLLQRLQRRILNEADYNCLVSCLLEAIRNNNSLLVKAPMEALMNNLDDRNIKSEGSKALLKNSLQAAIKNDCDSSIIHGIHRLLKKSVECSQTAVSSLNREVLMNAGGVAAGHWNDDMVVYSCVSLGLVDHAAIDDDCVEGTVRIGHACLTRVQSDVDATKQMQELSRFLSSKSTQAVVCPESTDSEMLKRIKRHIAFDKQPQIDEQCEIERNISQFMNELTDVLHTLFGIACSVSAVRVGSSEEGTRCFQPDEFDYLIVFTKINPVLTHKFYRGDFVFQATTEGVRELKDKVMLDEYKDIWYLLSDQAKYGVYDVIELFLREAATLYWQRFFSSGDSTPSCFRQCDSRLSIEPTGMFVRKAKFATAHLIWRGDVFPRMKIRVDLIPAFNIGYAEKLPQHALLETAKRKLPIISYGHFVLYTVGYSSVENDVVKRLPEHVKQGFVLAKAVRRAVVFNGLSHIRLVDDYEQLIPTYYLKTALLFLTKHGLEDLSNTRDVYVAMNIYQQLKEFIQNHGRIPHFFLNPENLENGECLFSCVHKLHHQRDRQETLLNVIDRILQFLQNDEVSMLHNVMVIHVASMNIAFFSIAKINSNMVLLSHTRI